MIDLQTVGAIFISWWDAVWFSVSKSRQKYTEIRCSAPLQISRKFRDSTSEKKPTKHPGRGMI